MVGHVAYAGDAESQRRVRGRLHRVSDLRHCRCYYQLGAGLLNSERSDCKVESIILVLGICVCVAGMCIELK